MWKTCQVWSHSLCCTPGFIQFSTSCCNPPGFWPLSMLVFPSPSFLPSVASIWASISLLRITWTPGNKRELRPLFCTKTSKSSVYPSQKRSPRWTISTHLEPLCVWSALCLLLGKTVKLREGKPDRTKPALLSDLFLVLKTKRKRWKRSSWGRWTIFLTC